MPFPEPRLALSVVVTDSDTGHNHATFTLTNAHTTGITVELDPGDGTTTVHMDIGADGTATGEKTYSAAGHHVYTATVTVPMTARYPTWADLYGALATWDAVPADTATWADLTATSETASVQVEVMTGDGAVWATAVDDTPPYAQVDTWSGRPDDITSWTVTRNVPAVPVSDRVVIYQGTTHPGAFSIEDDEAPFGVPISYTFTVTYTNGTRASWSSNSVTLTGGTGFGGCWVTDPAAGRSLRVTIAEWTTRDFAARQSVLAVMNRPDPIVLSDVHTWASGDIVLITATQADLTTLRAILNGSRIILIRSWAGSSIEAAYMAVGDYSESRIYATDPYAWDRSVSIAYQEIRPVPVTARDLRVSWGDIAASFATWAAVDDYFPTWADVVAWNPATSPVSEGASKILGQPPAVPPKFEGVSA
jgi:hypothetical protein